MKDKLSKKFHDLKAICYENHYYTQDFWKKVYNKIIEPKNYALINKVWLNNKYRKTK